MPPTHPRSRHRRLTALRQVFCASACALCIASALVLTIHALSRPRSRVAYQAGVGTAGGGAGCSAVVLGLAVGRFSDCDISLTTDDPPALGSSFYLLIGSLLLCLAVVALLRDPQRQGKPQRGGGLARGWGGAS